MLNSNPNSHTFNFDEAKAFKEELVSIWVQVTGRDELRTLDINTILQSFLNLIPNISISEFEISRATVPIPGYKPGIFPDDFSRISVIDEMETQVPQSLASSFIIEVSGASRIKARGFGELDLYKKGDEIHVEAKDLWYIEEIQEINPEPTSFVTSKATGSSLGMPLI